MLRDILLQQQGFYPGYHMNKYKKDQLGKINE